MIGEQILIQLAPASGVAGLVWAGCWASAASAFVDRNARMFESCTAIAVSDASVNRKQDVAFLAVWSKAGRFHALKDPAIAAKLIYFLQDPWRRHEPAAQFAFVFGL